MLSLIMEVCNIFLNNLNTFCKELYTCMCNITKELSFLVKILHNVTHNKDLKKKKTFKLYKLPRPNAFSVSSVVTSL